MGLILTPKIENVKDTGRTPNFKVNYPKNGNLIMQQTGDKSEWGR
jgi:hypothetical protein